MKKILMRLAAVSAAVVVAVILGIKLFVGAVNFPLGHGQASANELSAHVRLPPGFQVNVYADDVPNARELRLTHRGDLLVATPNRDQVLLLLRDANNDGRHDGKRVLLDKLNAPNGMDFYTDATQQDWLYVAEQNAIGRIRFDHNAGKTIGSYERVVSDLPGGGNHWKKSLRFGADGFMYVSIGSSCNACVENDTRRATLMRYQPDGSNEEIYASGLRNSEGFDWSPRDGALYATDNGRDLLGDDFPPCELNRIEPGRFYGWPFANGNRVPDPDNGAGHADEIALSLPPAHAFRAHNAPLGIAFLRSTRVPEGYRNAALVALHGSWNRSIKDGYKVVSLHWQTDGRIEERDFMAGFLQDDKTIGRPAEIVEASNGDIYISDDYAGAIYRVSYP